MGDGSDWTSPGGGAPQGPDGRDAEPPRYGERTPGWVAPAQAPAPPAAPAGPGPGGYAPPPRPGLIPLHPLSFGQLLGAAFAVIRWNPRAAVLPALVVSVLQNVVVLGLIAGIGFSAADRFSRAATADQDAILAGTIAQGVAGGLFSLAVTVFATALLQGMLVGVVAEGAVGRRIAVGATLRLALRRLPPLAGFALLVGALQVVAAVVVVGLVALLASLGGAGVIVAVLVGVVGGLGLLAAYLFLAVKLATVPSVIVLERLGVLAAVRRSWTLMRGDFWRVLGLLAVVTVMVSAASQIVSIPFSLISGAAGGLLFPNAGSSDDPTTLVGPLLISSLPATIAAAIVAGIGQVAQVSAVVLVYLDRRMRREGLDIELQRHVEGEGANPIDVAPAERRG